MREIKFRVFSKSDNKFVCCYQTGIRFTPDTGQIYINGTNFTDDFILEQFTGLKDKNGVDIYEGDIVKASTGVTGDDINYWSVEYVDHLAYCGFKFYGVDRRFNIKASRSSIVNNNIEIIGNIHESPELLNTTNIQ